MELDDTPCLSPKDGGVVVNEALALLRIIHLIKAIYNSCLYQKCGVRGWGNDSAVKHLMGKHKDRILITRKPPECQMGCWPAHKTNLGR